MFIKSGMSEHHVYSAYYDDRPLMYRPAVVLMGYVKRRSRNTFYCHFTYPGEEGGGGSWREGGEVIKGRREVGKGGGRWEGRIG